MTCTKYETVVGSRVAGRLVTGLLRKNGRPTFSLRCDCGRVTYVRASRVASGDVPACGRCNSTSISHGHSKGGQTTPEYRTWRSLIRRCSDPRHNRYEFYKNVPICGRWRGEDGFKNFLADMGPKPGSGYSIERVNNNGPYSPENCKWATAKEQARNRRSTETVTINGATKSLAEWAEETGINYWTLYRRIKVFGMDPAEAIRRAAPNRKNKKAELTVNGVTKSLAEWSAETGIPYTTLRGRISYGWDPVKIVTAPVRQ